MYKVCGTEKTRKKGSDYETKALLYLMGEHEDHARVERFVIDFFNDLTGVDQYDDEVWDVQSKGSKLSIPDIGRSLVSLFKNYLSEFEFDHYILFMGGIGNNALIDSKLKSFGINSFKIKNIQIIRNSLLEECKTKEYINETDITVGSVEDFLSNVLFVVGDKEGYEYIRNLVDINPDYKSDKVILESIFKEIRTVQSSKKDSEIEGKRLGRFDEYYQYYRYLEASDIRLMIINRLCSYNFANDKVPCSFIQYLEHLDDSDKKAYTNACRDEIYRVIFDQNLCDVFWPFFNNVHMCVCNNPGGDIDTIYDSLDMRLVKRIHHLSSGGLKFFISVLKDGYQ